MNIKTIAQPEQQLGIEISELLDSRIVFTRIVFVSAFVALRTILRLREKLLACVESGSRLCLTIGIDLGGTSREVAEELLRWNCETVIFHNPITRTTFHPKLYLFEGATSATLFIGSNNLTDGGFYTNYEAATRYDFSFPADRSEYDHLLQSLEPFLNPQGATAQVLTTDLIRTLVARGELPSEAEARRRRSERRSRPTRGQGVPANPFGPVAVPLPPLLPQGARQEEPEEPEEPQPVAPRQRRASQATSRRAPRRSRGVLVWRKVLTRSEALDVREGSHHVGSIRLTRANFETLLGEEIDQTTYFRRLFAEYPWEQERGRTRQADQEHTFVPMRVIIRGRDYGVRNFEITHKPSGEAGQDNFTTALRWGREFVPTVQRENLTGTILSLYETPEEEAGFLMDITDAA